MENPSPENDIKNQIPPLPKNWLVESILVTVFCCLPFGIIGIINAAEVKSKWATGDYAGAVESAARARKWVLIGFSLGLFIIGSLLLINVYLYIKYYQQSTRNQQLTEQVSIDSVQISDWNMKYQEALVNIESYKGQDVQLDSIIAVKEKALMDLKNNYTSLQEKTKISKSEYDRQIGSMNNIVNDLQTQITELQQQNKILITRNDSVGRSLAKEMTTASQLQNANATLLKKVSMASLLKPASITVTGARTNSSGKDDETNSAREAEKLKVCWDIPANNVAATGEKTFYVRVISPEGITLAAETSGSGVIKDANNAAPIQYSVSTTINYDEKATSACSEWKQRAPFSKGNYTVNIYQDGYLVGVQKFDLK